MSTEQETAVSTKDERVAAIDEAIKRGGGIVAFSKAMGVTHQAVYNWRNRGWAPIERALAMEAVFGINRYETMEPNTARALIASPDNTNV
jgi:transposase-like protein